ncbi:hypothetical protein L6164_024037 [Bauhinia variegata]|uniref:Uncharacterized protein n=1 Tax=Bauhinia variegata TaxID=167791 RepID=A0ACB9LWC1_BAUVA|nr:hypothetical protein L6164_024037 [Bauhinia variegata]
MTQETSAILETRSPLVQDFNGVDIVFLTGYCYHNDLDLEEAPTTSNLSEALWVSKGVLETDSLLSEESFRVVKDSLYQGSKCWFDVAACPSGVEVCEDRRAMPNLCKFIERFGSEAEVLRKKRKVGGSSSLASIVDYFLKEPQVVFTDPPAPSLATNLVILEAKNTHASSSNPVLEFEDLPMFVLTPLAEPTRGSMPSTTFNDQLEKQACPPLSGRRIKTKITTRRNEGRLFLGESCYVASSSSDLDPDTPMGADEPSARAQEVPSVDPPNSKSVIPARGPSSGPTGGGASIPPSTKVLRRQNGRHLQPKKRASAAEQKFAAAQHESAVAKERASNATSQLAEAKNRLATLEREFSSSMEYLNMLEEKDQTSAALIADLRADLISRDAKILILEGKVVTAKSLL